MKYSTYRFTLDLQKHQSQMSIAVFKHDTAVRLIISLTDGGKPYYIENECYGIFYGKRADNQELIHSCMIKDNTEIIYEFDPTTTAVEGLVKCQLRLYDGTNPNEPELITAPCFVIAVDERVVNDDDVEISGKSPTQALDELFLSEKGRKDAEHNREKVFETMKSWDTVIVKKMIDEGKTLNELLANASGKVYVNIPETLEISDEVIEVNSNIKLLEFNPLCILKATHTNGLTIRGYGERSSLYGDCQIIRGANSSWIEGGISDTNYYIDNFLGGVEHCHGNGWLIKNSENISHCRILGLSDCKKITHCTCAFGDYEEMKAENCSIIDELVLDAIIAPKFVGCTNISNIIGDVYHENSADPKPLTFDNCAYISNVKVQNITATGSIEVKPVYTNCAFVDPYTCDGFLSEDEKGKVRKLNDDGKLEFIEVVEKSEFESNDVWDLVITAEKLEGTDLDTLLKTAKGRVFVKAVGEFQGTTINVPGTVKFIEFAPSVIFGGGMPTVVSIKGTGNESDCQIIKGASTSSADPSYMGQCIIEGFKGGVEHCHGEGWVYKNCNNIEHCTFSSFENCKNISKCTSDRGAYNQYFDVAIINCTDIEDLQLADTTQRGYKFSNSKFIKNITFSTGTVGLYASLQFENCAYISNVEIQSYYTNCTFVDAYTCAGFLTNEDEGKAQGLTKDGSFNAVEGGKGGGVSSWDLIITSEMLQGTNLNTVLVSASGSVFVKAIDDSTTINVPSAVKLIEFAPDVIFQSIVKIAGTGEDNDCQVIKGATNQANGTGQSVSQTNACSIQGFKGGVEHCHGAGWYITNCNNINHCTIVYLSSCNDISHCSVLDNITSEVRAYIKNCTNIEGLTSPNIGTVRNGIQFEDCLFIRDVVMNNKTFFYRCSYIQNIYNPDGKTVTYDANCKFVDPYTCDGFLADEDVGKIQVLTKDGTFSTAVI